MNLTTTATTIQDSQQYNELLEKIRTAVTESKERVAMVMTSTDVETCSHYVKNFGTLAKAIETQRKSIVDPMNAEVKEINSLFKKLALIFSDEEERLKKMLLDYNAKMRKLEEEKARIEREKQAEAARIERERMLKEAEERRAAGEEVTVMEVEEVIIPQTIPTATKLSQKNSSGVGTMRIKKWSVVNIDEVPREFLMIDEQKVNAIRKAADFDAYSTIPGIKFYTEESIRR